MKKDETGKSLVEMLAVLALIGIIGMTGVMGYQSAVAMNKANQTAELVSIASMTGKTQIKSYDNGAIWKAIGKKKDDYKCVSSLSVDSKGVVEIKFETTDDCQKVKNSVINQWGNNWNEGTNTYTPPKDDAI